MNKYLLFSLFTFFVITRIEASVYTVTNTLDSGTGSFRASVNLCNANDTVRFNPNLIANGSDSIVLTSEVYCSTKINIIGLYTLTDTLFISGGQSSRILWFSSATKVTLDSLVLINGLGNTNGGAIYVNWVDSLIIKGLF